MVTFSFASGVTCWVRDPPADECGTTPGLAEHLCLNGLLVWSCIVTGNGLVLGSAGEREGSPTYG